MVAVPELQSLVFGATLAAGIGPIALLIVTVAASDGPLAGLGAACGAGLADFTLAVGAFLGGATLARRLTELAPWFRTVAGAVLLLLGLWMLWRAWTSRSAEGAPPKRVLSAPLPQTYALTLVNPMTIVLFVAFSAQLPPATSVLVSVWYALWVLVGSLAVQLTLAGVGMASRRGLMTPARIRWFNVASALGIAAYGLAGLRVSLV